VTEGAAGGGRDDPVVVYRRYAWNRALPFGSGAVCGGRGQLAESVFPFHSREGPPFWSYGTVGNIQRHTSTSSRRANLPRSSAYFSE
jgi:hypothetical protein